MRWVAGLIVFAALGAVVPAQAHYAPSGMNCGSVAFTPNTDAGASSIRAKGISCRTARRVVKSHGRGNASPLGYTCKSRVRTDGDAQLALAHDDVRCKRGKRVITFART